MLTAERSDWAVAPPFPVWVCQSVMMNSRSSFFSCASTLGLALYYSRKNVHFDLEDILCKLSNQSINAP